MIIIICAIAIGDSICCTPTLRKLSKIHDTKIEVHSNHPDLFKNLPYVKNSFKLDTSTNISCNYVFWDPTRQHLNHTFIDLKQYPAYQAGFQLLSTELSCDYIPDKNTDDLSKFNLPNKYVVVHAPQSWPIKKWSQSKWQTLCNRISLPVISIGKSYIVDEPNVDGSQGGYVYGLSNLNNVIDLTNKLTLDQVWHLCNKAKYVITTDSGILHLAGTTKSAIIYIAIGRHPELTKPYKDNIYTISNNCKFCMSNIEILNKKQNANLSHCQINSTNETCQPSVDQVLEVIDG